ncbi:MAG: hypothetical protein LBK53_07390 [Heliobacteriaceae bacterium]|jgi:hypothetical protein|nr:hypothetical protein [Heliobacteriaceae bacterium]
MAGNVPGIGYGGFNYNDDFLASQYFNSMYNQGNNYPQNYPVNPNFTGNNGAPADTFEKQGGSGVTTAAITTLGAAGATGAGLYFFGTNPVKDGKLVDGFSQEFGRLYTASLREQELSKALKTAKLNPKVLEELTQYGNESVEFKDLSKKAQKYITDNKIKTPKTTASFVEKIVQDVDNKVNSADFHLQNQNLNNLKTLEEQFKALPDKKLNTLKDFVKKNAKEFGITATDEKEITKEIDKLLKKPNGAKTFSYSSHIKKMITDNIKTQETVVDNSKNLYENVAQSWNKDKNIFAGKNKMINEATEKGLRNFKWKTAGKWAAAAAGAALVLNFIFGGSKKSA